MKKTFHKLFRMTGQLNLYITSGAAKKERVIQELKNIEALSHELLKEVLNFSIDIE